MNKEVSKWHETTIEIFYCIGLITFYVQKHVENYSFSNFFVFKLMLAYVFSPLGDDRQCLIINYQSFDPFMLIITIFQNHKLMCPKPTFPQITTYLFIILI
jgi:hypothetical protein